MASKKLSYAQIRVLERFAYCAGAKEIQRQPGGFWTIGGIPKEEWYATTPTVKALANMGALEASRWGWAGHKSFVVAYQLTEMGQQGVRLLARPSTEKDLQ